MNDPGGARVVLHGDGTVAGGLDATHVTLGLRVMRVSTGSLSHMNPSDLRASPTRPQSVRALSREARMFSHRRVSANTGSLGRVAC